MTTLERICLECKRPFQAQVKHINYYGDVKYCSRLCSRKMQRQKKLRVPNVVCAYCQKEFWVRPQRIKDSKSGLLFCCREHKDVASRLGGIKAIQPPHYGKAEIFDYRIKALRHYPPICNRCGYDKFVVVHHKDHDRKNNDLVNLEILYPNCHALEHWLVGETGNDPA